MVQICEYNTVFFKPNSDQPKKKEKKNISIAPDYKSQQCPLVAVSVRITNM